MGRSRPSDSFLKTTALALHALVAPSSVRKALVPACGLADRSLGGYRFSTSHANESFPL